MADKPFGKAEAEALFADSVRILREDMTRAEFKRVHERLDEVTRQTRKDPQTPEEKAKAWDDYQATLNATPPAPPTQTPPPSPGGPTPPPKKDPEPPKEPKKDWWWGDRETGT